MLNLARVGNKGHWEVERTLYRLCQGRDLHITPGSENNLRALYRLLPQLTRLFLQNLRRLTAQGVNINQLIVPANLGEIQNRRLLINLAQPDFVRPLVDKDGVLDLRKAGFREKVPYIDLTPNYKRPSLDDLRQNMVSAREILQRDQSQATLFLYHAVLRARIELYQAGEERSAEGRVELTPRLAAVRDFLLFTVEQFPFNDRAELLAIGAKLAMAAELISQRNNPGADATLAPLTGRLGTLLRSRLEQKVRASQRARGWKVTEDETRPGYWVIVGSGYYRAESGLLIKGPIERHVSTAKLLSQFDDQIKSFSEEIDRNEAFITQLAEREQQLPADWDKLFEIFLKFTRYFELHKEKAAIEIEAALQLAVIPSDQALALAKTMLSLAVEDLRLRQRELAAQKERFTQLRAENESALGVLAASYEERCGEALLTPEIIADVGVIDRLDHDLAVLLGTYYKEDMREDWLKLAKSRLEGLRQDLPGMRQLIERRNSLLTQIGVIKAGFKAASITPVVATQQLKSALVELNEATNAFFAARRQALSSILGDRAPVAEVDRQNDKVMAISSKSRPLGIVLREDARTLGLRFAEIYWG